MKKLFNLKNIKTVLTVAEIGLSLLNIIMSTRELIKTVKKNKTEEVICNIDGDSKFAELTIDNIVK